MRPLIDAGPLAALRHRAFSAYPQYRADGRALADHAGFLSKGLDGARRGGLHLRSRGRALDAYVLWWPEERAWFGGPAQMLFLDYRVDRPDAGAWVLDVLERERERFTDDLLVHLPSIYTPVRDWLLANGYGVDSVILQGNVADGLQRLEAGCAPAPDFTAFGLSMRAAESEDVPALVALRQRVFTAEPQYCWFGADDVYLEKWRTTLARRVDAGDGVYRVVERDAELVGFFSAEPDDTALWGLCAGMEFIFAPSMRGKGCVKIAYCVLLAALSAAGCRWFRGGTAQPAVMSLGRLMGRTLMETTHRRDVCFGADHFDDYLLYSAAATAQEVSGESVS